MFNNGRNVVVIPISNDPIEELASWAKDADFPFLFASDLDGSVYASYGGNPRDGGSVGSRAVVVIDPEGNISSLTPRFQQTDPQAYVDLAEEVDAVTPTAEIP